MYYCAEKLPFSVYMFIFIYVRFRSCMDAPILLRRGGVVFICLMFYKHVWGWNVMATIFINIFPVYLFYLYFVCMLIICHYLFEYFFGASSCLVVVEILNAMWFISYLSSTYKILQKHVPPPHIWLLCPQMSAGAPGRVSSHPDGPLHPAVCGHGSEGRAENVRKTSAIQGLTLHQFSC